MLELYRDGLYLYSDTVTVPCQGSVNIPIALTVPNGSDEYLAHAVQPKVSYHDGTVWQSVLVPYEDGQFDLPAQVFAVSGFKKISVGLIKEGKEYVTNEIKLIVNSAPTGTVVLPISPQWNDLVDSYITQNFSTVQEDLASIAPSIEEMVTKVDAKIKEMEAPLFTQATERVNIYSGETFGVLFGKISKWFGDLRSAAFADVKNNVTTEDDGGVLDARMGKYLNDRIDAVSNSVNLYSSVISFNAGYATIPITYSGDAPTVMAQLANAGGIVVTSCCVTGDNISIRCANVSDGSTYSGNQTVSILINAY